MTAKTDFLDLDIPSKDDRLKSQLVDGCRLLAWQRYKSNHKVPQGQSSFAFYSQLYSQFEPHWKAHKIHSMSLQEVLVLIKERGYSQNELLNFRAQEYQKRPKKATTTYHYDEEEMY